MMQNEFISEGQNVDSDVISRCRQEQEEELTVLKSMYTIPDELQFIVGNFPNDSDFQTQEEEFANDFSLKLRDLVENAAIEFSFEFPPTYPLLEPLSVYVRSSALTGEQSRRLNCAIRDQIDKTQSTEPFRVNDVIDWLRSNFQQFVDVSATRPTLSENDAKRKVRHFERLWLYSHHIYSRFKRKDILSLAGQFRLTGFSMPGKPGVVCIEGAEEDCREFWETVRSWTWKKIIIKHRESIELNADQTVDGLRRFPPLKEIGFDAKHGAGREFHMNMGLFHKYLIEHHCDYVFSILFNIEANGACKE